MARMEGDGASIQEYLIRASEVLQAGQVINEALSRMTQLLVPALADWSIVWSIDQEGRWFPRASAHYDAEKQAVLQELAEYVAESGADSVERRAVESRQPATEMNVTDARLDEMAYGDSEYVRLVRPLAPGSLIVVPLIARTRVVGAMEVATDRDKEEYTDEDLNIARQIAVPYALALDNAQTLVSEQQALQEAQRIRGRLQLAYDITSRLLERPSLEEVGGELLQLVGERLGWDMGALWTFDETTRTLRRASMWQSSEMGNRAFQDVEATQAYRSGEGIVGRTLATGEAEWLSELRNLNGDASARTQMARELGLRSALFLPLTSPSGLVGMIELFSREPKQRDEEEFEALTVLASQVGNVIASQRTQQLVQQLSTPVLQIQERLLLFPIVGVLDRDRLRMLTERVLRGIREHRAKVIVLDITGATLEQGIADGLLQTIEASRLLGVTVFITGISPDVANSMVSVGLNLSHVGTPGNLQAGIEEATRFLHEQIGD